MSQGKYGITSSNLPQPSTSFPNASTYLDFIQNRRGKIVQNAQPLFLSQDEKMARIQDIIWQISDTKIPVLITGESGAGKEIVARAIHTASFDKEDHKPFVAVNCAAMPATLLESELFGFEKGSFTGANQKHIGKFEQANNGTILLDEITEMDLSLQSKLLRVLQEKEIDRIGGREPVPISTRIIATTNRDILSLVNQGKFRQDLYYRLYVLHIEVPPLRDRPKDIRLLASKFLEDSSLGLNRSGMSFSEDAIKKLLSYSWPGNVRELQNVVQRAAILSKNHVITEDFIPLEESRKSVSLDWIAALPIGQTLRKVETHFILETLKHHSGNRTHAAKTLGISLRTLRNKINEFTAEGLEVIMPFGGKI